MFCALQKKKTLKNSVPYQQRVVVVIFSLHFCFFANKGQHFVQMFSDSDANGGPKAMLFLGRRLLLYTPAHVRTQQYAQRLLEAQLQLGKSCGQQSSSCGLVTSGWCHSAARRLSLLYYLSLLQYVTRLLLYSLLRGAYTPLDPLMAVLDALTTHHLVGVCLAAFGVIAFYMDYVLTLAAPSRHLTTVLLDIMVFNRGS